MELDIGRINVVIAERYETVRLCVTCNPDDDKQDLIDRFKPEGAEWQFLKANDQGDHMYVTYHKFFHPRI